MSYGYETQSMDDPPEEEDVAHTRPSSSPTHDTISQYDEEQSDGDNEIELELVVEYMANGHSDMESKAYTLAEENFRSAIELAEEHDFSKKLDYGPGDITLILVDCLLRQNKEEEALELLESVADGSVSTHHSDMISVRAGSVVDGGRDQITQFKACHKIATIFMNRADTQAAEKRAQQAFKGRRKVCGPYDSATLESVQLLIDIFTARNDKTKARAYRRFLEPSTRTRPSIGGDTPTGDSAVPSIPPIPPPGSQPVMAATLTSPFLGTPDKIDAATIQSITSAPLETSKTPKSHPRHSFTASTSPRASLSSTGPLARIAEVESIPPVQKSSETENERSALRLSNSIRAAVQTASTSSTLPASPTAHVAKPANVFPATSSPSQTIKPVKVLQATQALISASSAVSVPEDTVRTTSLPAPLSAKAQNPTLPGYQPGSVVAPQYPLIGLELTATIPTQGKIAAPTSVGISRPATKISPVATTIASGLIPVNDTADTSSPPVSLYASSSVKTSSSTASVPSPSRTKRSTDVNPAKNGVLTLATTSASILPPIHVSRHVSELPSTTTTSQDVVSPVEASNSVEYPTYSRSTTSPPAVAPSASQSALASMFAELSGKPAEKSSPLASTASSTTLSSKYADGVTASTLPARQPSPLKETLSTPTVVSPTLTSYPTAEIPLTDEDPQQEEVCPPSRTFSWFTDTKPIMPSSVSRSMSSQTTTPQATALTNANLAPSATTKRKSWAIPFGRGKTDGDTKRLSTFPPPPPIPESTPSIYALSRNPSLTTIQSNAEPKRQKSLIASIGSQPLNFLNKELSFSSDKSPRGSISRSLTSASQVPSRSRQELAPRFTSIKAMRAEGKKSASIDAALKLLREYDLEKKTLVVRESELKKNMKESHKGLASTGHGYAPIHLFCDRRTEAVVEIELLIEQGVDVNAVACKAGMPGHEPFTPLQRAIEHGHAEIVRLLVEADVAIAPPRPQKGAPNATTDTINHPLLLACTKGHTKITYTLLHAGAARLVKEFPHRQWHGNSLLHEACWRADTTMVKMLLDYLRSLKSQYHSSSGPDFESGVIGAPGQQDRFGATPIMYAIDLRDCTSQRMREQKSARRKECLRLLLEHEIHGDLHSQQYRDNIARVLSTKWTRGPGKGHSIFCYSDEAGDEELSHLLNPFRYQVSPGSRCHATPQCTALRGSSVHSGSAKSGITDRQTKLPDFPELMSVPVERPAGSNGGGASFELPGLVGELSFAFDTVAARSKGAPAGSENMLPSPVTVMTHGNENKSRSGYVGGVSEIG